MTYYEVFAKQAVVNVTHYHRRDFAGDSGVCEIEIENSVLANQIFVSAVHFVHHRNIVHHRNNERTKLHATKRGFAKLESRLFSQKFGM